MEEDTIYKDAMKRIDDLVEEVFLICDEVADENHYERIWVLDRFREQFNKAKRKIKWTYVNITNPEVSQSLFFRKLYTSEGA